MRRAVIFATVSAVPLAMGGFIAAALLFGDPPAKGIWTGAAIVLGGVGIAGEFMANRRAERARREESQWPG